MGLKIECPICEAVFSVAAAKKNDTLACPACQKKFVVQPENLVSHRKETATAAGHSTSVDESKSKKIAAAAKLPAQVKGQLPPPIPGQRPAAKNSSAATKKAVRTPQKNSQKSAASESSKRKAIDVPVAIPTVVTNEAGPSGSRPGSAKPIAAPSVSLPINGEPPVPQAPEDQAPTPKVPASKVPASKAPAKKSRFKTAEYAGPLPSSPPEPIKKVAAKSPSSSVPFATSVDAPDAPGVPVALAIPIAEPGVEKIIDRHQEKIRRSTIVTIVVAIVLVAAISGLATWLVVEILKDDQTIIDDDVVAQMERGPDSPSSRSAAVLNSKGNSDGSFDPDIEIPNIAVPDLVEPKQVILPKKIRSEDLPPEKFEFLSRGEVNEVWAISQPRLVSLEVLDAKGTHQATGFIVDSRGWILTSFPAIAGAYKVRIKASPTSIDEMDAELLSDEVRGVIGDDAEKSTLLMSVNRRFVVSFGKMLHESRVRIVAGQYLIQVAPPSVDNPYSRVELEVLYRKSFGELGADAKLAARRRNLTNEKLTWLITDLKASPLPGTPLLTQKGKLAAIHQFNLGDKAYFVIADQVESMLASLEDEAKPLQSIMTSKQRRALANTVIEKHPMQRNSLALNRSGQRCESFGWIATNEDQYREYQKFAGLMTRALMYTMANSDEPSEEKFVSQLKKQVQQWRNSMSQSLGKADGLSAEQIGYFKKMNRLAMGQMLEKTSTGRRQFIPVFGKVYLAGPMSPDPDSMYLKIQIADPEKKEAFVKIPFETRGQTMLPNSDWLYFIRRGTRRRVARFKEGEEIKKAESGILQFAIGPL